MKNIFFIFLFSSVVFSQSSNWWIYFSDKACSTDINLSFESVERRSLQGIEFDFYDIPVCDDYIKIINKYDLSIRHQSRWLNAVSVSVKSIDVIEQLKELNFVQEIKRVKTLKNSNKFNGSINLVNNNIYRSFINSYGPSFNQINMLGGVDLHNQGFVGNGIVIAVFDAGFTQTETLPIFNNLWINNQIVDTYDFVNNDTNVFLGSIHGTMVLSTMGGYMPDSLIGTAPGATYMLFRTEDSSSETLVEEDNWAAAAEYADSVGAHIINSSLGYTILYDDTINSHSYNDMDGNSTIITNAADLAASRGILVVNSAGNSGNNDWYYIGAPADGDSVLAVGAVNAIGEVASFSSRGPSYDGRIKPNVCAQGVYTVVADVDSTVRLANGTSFSSPLIAGLAACLWQSDTSLTNMELIDVIQESAHLFDNSNDSLGYGIPNFYQAFLSNLEIDAQFSSVSYFPNPFSNHFTLYNKTNNNITIDIFNIIGDMIYSSILNPWHNNLDLSFAKSGLYFLKIRENNEVFKIIKN
tara:strand:+ start:3809 stop:5383 length:1575 start_codon:yes stop_codon:yes gene_type:complete